VHAAAVRSTPDDIGNDRPVTVSRETVGRPDPAVRRRGVRGRVPSVGPASVSRETLQRSGHGRARRGDASRGRRVCARRAFPAWAPASVSRETVQRSGARPHRPRGGFSRPGARLRPSRGCRSRSTVSRESGPLSNGTLRARRVVVVAWVTLPVRLPVVALRALRVKRSVERRRGGRPCAVGRGAASA
jgi:hypothetical protein